VKNEGRREGGREGRKGGKEGREEGRKEGRKEIIIIIIILELVHGEQVGLNQRVQPFHTHAHSLHSLYTICPPSTHSFMHAFKDTKIHLHVTV